MRKGWVLLLIVIVLLLSIGHVHAEPKSQLLISPLRTKPTLDPGSTSVASLKIKNLTKDALNVDLQVQNFKPANEDYDYLFETTETVNWVRLTETGVTLAPNEEKEVSYSVAIPNNATPGGYYFSIFASTENTNADNNVREIKQVGSLIFLQVNGDITRMAKIINLDVASVSFNRQVPIMLRVANQGSSHIETDTRLKVRGYGGQEIRLKGLVIPGSIRKLNGTLTFPVLPGIYKINVNFTTNGTSTQELSRWVLYIPVWSIIILVGLITLIVIILLRRRRKRRTSN